MHRLLISRASLAARFCPYRAGRVAVLARAQQQTLDERSHDNNGSHSQEAEDEAYTRNFASSLATLGLGATLLSERLNGAGLVQQLDLELGEATMFPVLVITIGSLLVAALKPTKAQEPKDVAAATAATVQSLAGRVSFLGLAATLAAEMLTGKGLLGMLHIDTGVELSEVEGILAFLVMLILTNTNPRHVNPRT